LRTPLVHHLIQNLMSKYPQTDSKKTPLLRRFFIGRRIDKDNSLQPFLT
jgi:hypothetical protein